MNPFAVAAGFFVAAVSAVAVVPMVGLSQISSAAHLNGLSQAPTAVALEDIPASRMRDYMDAALRCDRDLPWPVIAGIGKVEGDHGRERTPEFPPVPETELSHPDGPVTPIVVSVRIGALADWLCAQTWSDPDEIAGTYSADAEWVAQVNEHAAGYGMPVFEDDTLEPVVALTAADLDTAGCPTAPTPESTTTVVRGFRVHTCIAGNVEAMLATAAADGYTFGGWGWRDNAKQIDLRRRHCGRSHYAVYQMPAAQCKPPTARPGQSQHERGLALDLTYEGKTIKSRQSAAFRWMTANGQAFGFYNLPSEPWHWSINGR